MHDVSELLQALALSPSILASFVSSIPEAKLHLRRGEGFWTIAEHVSHLAQVQPMLLNRLERFESEEHPVFVPYLPGAQDDPDASAPMPTASALDQFASCREEQLRLLKRVDEATWKRTATHPEYDRYSLYILTRHILMHDHWHMYRMEELWLTKDEYLTRLE